MSLSTSVALKMADREELWLSTALLDSGENELQHLLASGLFVLDEGKQRIAFSHQTLFEFALSRAFARGRHVLSEYVWARQDALFVRATLWTALRYLRRIDTKTYLAEIEQLWSGKKTRQHVRSLLLEFLGRCEAPEEREQQIVFGLLDGQPLTRLALNSIAGNKRWFELIRDVYLPPLMMSERAEWTIHILARATEFDAASVGRLMNECWSSGKAGRGLIASVLWQPTKWDESFTSLALDVAEHRDVAHHLLEGMIASLSDLKPALAPHVFAQAILGEMTAIGASNLSLDDKRAAYDRLLTNAGGFTTTDQVADSAPAAFVETVWPCFVELAARVGVATWKTTYQDDRSIDTTPRSTRGSLSLAAAVDIALTKLARDDERTFDGFVERWAASEHLAVHRFLCSAIEAGLPRNAQAAHRYLMGDKRRLVIGDVQGDAALSESLIRALAPFLDAEQVVALEGLIGTATIYDETSDPHVEGRRAASQGNRQLRLSLLRAIGIERLSLKSRAEVESALRRFPVEKERADQRPFEVHVSESRMKADEMKRARNEDIVILVGISDGFTFRQSPEYANWAGALRRHLEREESPKIWLALSDRLRLLLNFGDEGADVLDALFSKYPSVRNSNEGAVLIAYAVERAPRHAKKWLKALPRSTWRDDQAYGELLSLFGLPTSAPSWAIHEIESALDEFAQTQSNSSLVRGLAHGASQLWGSRRHRKASTALLLRVIPHADEVLSEIVMRAFGAVDVLQWDQDTHGLIDTLTRNPTVVAKGKSPWIADSLRSLLPGAADQVADLCLRWVEAAAKLPSVALQREIVDIALTLQRLSGPVRAKGLDLFEALLDANTYGAHEVLEEIHPDAPAPRQVRARPPRRRRRPRR